MKSLKLLIFALLFVAGQQTFAQNIDVHNHFITSVDINFNFKAPCPIVPTSTPTMGTSSTPFTSGCSLLSLDVSFVDDSCLPPAVVSFTIPFTTNPTHFDYVLCSGQVLHFDIGFTGTDYLVDINL